VFGFIESEKANHDVRRMCQLLKVSSSGFYAWRQRPLCPRKQEDARLRELIIAIQQRSAATTGRPGSGTSSDTTTTSAARASGSGA